MNSAAHQRCCKHKWQKRPAWVFIGDRRIKCQICGAIACREPDIEDSQHWLSLTSK